MKNIRRSFIAKFGAVVITTQYTGGECERMHGKNKLLLSPLWLHCVRKMRGPWPP